MRCRKKTVLHVSFCEGCVRPWDVGEPEGLCAMYACVCVCMCVCAHVCVRCPCNQNELHKNIC